MKNILAVIALVGVAVACNEGIDDISAVAPGPDETAPEVAITYPSEGTQIRVKEDVAPISIEFEVEDDIEIESISVQIDGTEIAELTDFIDYRRAVAVETYETLANGPHTVTIIAKDLSGKTTSESVNFDKVEPYNTKYDGEMFYMPFDGDYLELVEIKTATKVGSPGFSDIVKEGLKSYAGAAGGYLTYPTTDIKTNEFSAAFWYKINASPDRSGILTMGPPDPNLPATPNNRKAGFRFFREGSATAQTFKLNVGDGAADSWFDGGAAATINPTTMTDWVHLAFTISDTKVVVYINGVAVSQGSFPGVSWEGCDILSIASGAPRFTEWGHMSDVSLYDELRLFSKALTAEEVQAVMDGD